MIIGAVLNFFSYLFGKLLSVIPLPSPPAWMSTSGPVASVFAGAQHLGAWFPVTLVSTVILTVAAINITGFLVKLARIALSLFTGGGGGAA